jgi:uncharacterized membrane protein YphA (DoxX/SURF4 family)
MLAAVFIGQGLDALRSPKLAADAARPTLEGLQKLPDPVGSGVPPDAETFAKVNAAVQVGGGLLLATGRLPRFASAALAATVIPANLGAHMFWSETDHQRKAQKRREFMTDISLLGGLIIASADTAGKPSLGWRGRRAARKVSEAVSDRLPGSSSAVLDSELADKVGHGHPVVGGSLHRRTVGVHRLHRHRGHHQQQPDQAGQARRAGRRHPGGQGLIPGQITRPSSSTTIRPLTDKIVSMTDQVLMV